jgi:hypothetical protein
MTPPASCLRCVATGPRDFLVRAAALESLVADGRARFSSNDFAEILYWIDVPVRERTLGALRRSGWLRHEPSEGTALTTEGRWAYDVLSFLHRRLSESELLPTVAGVDYALEIGLDPLRHLQSMRAQLASLREELESARRTRSEVVLRDAAVRLRAALSLSEKIRHILDRVQTANDVARAVARDVHDLLSRLHLVAADLEKEITEVGRQYMRLTAGLTVEQIVRALMSCSLDELAAVGGAALLPVHVPPPLVTPEIVAGAAEWQFARERVEKEPVQWDEPPPITYEEQAMLVPSEVVELLSDLRSVAAGGTAVHLREFVPRIDPGSSFLRVTLLPLVDDVRAGDGVTGQLGATGVEVQTDGDGWPEDLQVSSLRRLTPGVVLPRRRSQ